jgi:hypothetical protein
MMWFNLRGLGLRVPQYFLLIASRCLHGTSCDNLSSHAALGSLVSYPALRWSILHTKFSYYTAGSGADSLNDLRVRTVKSIQAGLSRFIHIVSILPR